MRLRELSFARFAVGHETQVPLSPLVLLFGANSAGKTTILELFAQALGERSTTDQARSASPWHAMGNEDAYVLVELDALDVPDSPDRQLLLDALLANKPRSSEDEASLDMWEQDQNRPDLETELAKLRERMERELNWDLITEDTDAVPPDPEAIARLVNNLTHALWVRFIGGFVTLITKPTLLEQDRVLLELLLTADRNWSPVAGFLLEYGEVASILGCKSRQA
ncbi:MAG: ATP-binding protein [Acidimicrobiales bacterium]